MIKSYLNGFGRFGLHFLSYYLDRARTTNFRLLEINDEVLTVAEMLKIIHNDRYVRILDKWVVESFNNRVTFKRGVEQYSINFYNLKLDNFVGEKTGLFFECSGKYTDIKNFSSQHKFERVYISATSLSADATLIVGYNEGEYSPNFKFISYGSCTVNAFVPLASAINKEFTVLDSDVNVIHNVPEHILGNSPELFQRRDCTLNIMGPRLLKFLTAENFNVNYTLLPITGVSRIDFRFALKKSFFYNDVIELIQNIRSSSKKPLYNILNSDTGPDHILLSDYSVEIILNQSRKVGKNLYLSGYFDTENSVNRYYDLIQIIEERYT